jgi:hypothetical protein
MTTVERRQAVTLSLPETIPVLVTIMMLLIMCVSVMPALPATEPQPAQRSAGSEVQVSPSGSGQVHQRISSALQEARDGATVVVRPGTYAFAGNVIWPLNKALTLRCEPGAVFTRDAGYRSTFFELRGTKEGAAPRDSRITGCRFEGDARLRQVGIYVIGGISDEASPRQLRFDHNTVAHYAGDFINIRSFTPGVPNHISIDHNTFQDFWENPVDIVSGRFIEVAENTAQLSGLVAGAGGSSPFMVSIADGCPCTPIATDITFRQNTVTGRGNTSNFTGISINNGNRGFFPDFQNFLVTGNTIQGISKGISVTYYDKEAGAGRSDAIGVRIEQNTIREVMAQGIHLVGGSGHVVIGNRIDSARTQRPNAYDAIALKDVFQSVIRKNTIAGPTFRFGIAQGLSPRSRTSTDNQIEDNAVGQIGRGALQQLPPSAGMTP